MRLAPQAAPVPTPCLAQTRPRPAPRSTFRARIESRVPPTRPPPDPTRAARWLVRCCPAARARARAGAGARAGAERAWSLEHDQHLALFDHVRFLDPDLFHSARARRHDGNLHLHRLEDEEGVFLGDLVAGLRRDPPNAAHELCLYFRHRPSLAVRSSPSWVLASATVATSRPRSCTRRVAFSTRSPLLFAIFPCSK